MKITLTSFIFFTAGLIWVCPPANAQTSVNTSGGMVTGSGGSVAYSIGQVVYTTCIGSGTVAQGIQHPYEIFSSGILETEFNISLKMYPNPSSDSVVLDIGDFKNEACSYLLFDMHGKLIHNGGVEMRQTVLNTTDLPVGTYIIFVQNQDNKKVQSLKFIKI